MNETFGEKLKMARAVLGLNQVEMGDLFGVSYRTMTTWEADKGSPAGLHVNLTEYILENRAHIKPAEARAVYQRRGMLGLLGWILSGGKLPIQQASQVVKTDTTLAEEPPPENQVLPSKPETTTGVKKILARPFSQNDSKGDPNGLDDVPIPILTKAYQFTLQPDQIGTWVDTPKHELGGKSPQDLIGFAEGRVRIFKLLQKISERNGKRLSYE